MRPVMTRFGQGNGLVGLLYMAMEQSEKWWLLAFTVGLGQKPRRRSVPRGDVAGVLREIEGAKRRFRLAADAGVISCYEAGQEGFWVHRALVAEGIENLVVDSSSIDVNRRQKRAKTDKLDAGKLVTKLVQYVAGDQKVWSVVRVPSEEVEDTRQNDRELERLTDEQTALVNQIRGLLKTQDLRPGSLRDLPRLLSELRGWDGKALRAELKARLARAWERLHLVRQQIRAVEKRRQELIAGEGRPAQVARQLMSLKALGPGFSWKLAVELFGWRAFDNRRQVAGLVGLWSVPNQSGTIFRDIGGAKIGRARLRAAIVELAWIWVQHQPSSSLTHWFQRRFAGGGKRLRRIGIVALARRLLIELWKYVETGVLPEGALLKA